MIKKILKWFAGLIFTCLLILAIITFIIGGGFGEKQTASLLNEGVPIAFAHRGLANYYVENSMDAFINSKKIGFKAIETDVNCTKDQQLVIFHGESCKNLLGVEANIDAISFDEIKDKELLYNGVKTKNKIISLDQFLRTFKDSLIIYLDIKKVNKSVADNLLGYVNKYDLFNTVLIADANIIFLSYLKFKEPKIKTVLEGFNAGKEWLYYIIPRNFKPDFYSSFLANVDEQHMQFLRKNNLLNNRIVYGVNHDNIAKVYELGIRNIIIDYDSLLGSYEEIELLLTKNKRD